MAEVLSVQGLTKSYVGTRALKGVSLTVGAGQVFGLLGPNGSGKTTTLGIVLGAVRADTGSYRWFGQGTSGRERRRIGALLEQPSFYPWLSGDDNLSVVAAVKGLPAAATAGPLQATGLWDVRERLFQTYSLGMKQRLGIAAALLGKPEVLVLDEPTNGVDAQGIFDIRQLISSFADAGGTVILASHILDEVEKVCSHVAILKDGEILTTGATAEILATQGWTELAAPDLTALEHALVRLEPDAQVRRRGEVLELHGAKLPPAELNRRLAEGGLFLAHLAQRQPTLETQYLHLVGSGGPS